jgi:Flp pilus assembly pilin Flp
MGAWIQRFLTEPVRRLLHDESGLEEVEIGVVAAMLVVVGAIVFIAIGNDSELSLQALQKATELMANQTGS